MLEHARKVSVGIDAEMRSDQREDVAAVTRGAIRPQPRLVAIEHDLEAVARTAQHIADQEFAASRFLPAGNSRGQHRLQPREQFGADRFALGRRDPRNRCGACR